VFLSFVQRYRYAFVMLMVMTLLQILFASSAFAQTITPAEQTLRSCNFGRDMGAGINRIIAGALIGLMFMAVAIGAVFQRGNSGGSGSALMGVLIGGIDLGSALFLGLGMFATFASIVISAATLPACPA
jgi:hypothetical protein